ncbi:hypothetical protein BU15DRAFT_68174 [Melanogaster broomeanus]|nr:hypothetical protein BU15DRAFT_68174 [Melanogaster broomeanus]
MKTPRRRGNSSYRIAIWQPEAYDRAHASTLLGQNPLPSHGNAPRVCLPLLTGTVWPTVTNEMNGVLLVWIYPQAQPNRRDPINVRSWKDNSWYRPVSHNVKNVCYLVRVYDEAARRRTRDSVYARVCCGGLSEVSSMHERKPKGGDDTANTSRMTDGDGDMARFAVYCQIWGFLCASAVYYKCEYGVGFTTHEVTCAERQERFSLAMMNVHRRSLEEVEERDGEVDKPAVDVEGPASINDKPKWMNEHQREWGPLGCSTWRRACSLIVEPSVDLLGLLLSLQGTTWKIGPSHTTVPERIRCCLVSIRGRVGCGFGVVPLEIVVTGWVYTMNSSSIRWRR